MDKTKAKKIIDKLSTLYEDKAALNFNSIFELLIAVILSAQCTDKRVNVVTQKLFAVANTPSMMLEMGEEKLSEYIRSCGLYKNKAANIIKCCGQLIDEYGGNVPNDLQKLQTLAGVGRKTANVVYSVGFHGDAIAVDTHVFRVSNRIGLANGKNPLVVEKQLNDILQKQTWSKAHHYLIYHGRNVCKAQGYNCSVCAINQLCEFGGKNIE